jgi:hypothetical protein
LSRVYSLIVVAALLSGCVKVEQDLVLNPDGTGTLKFVYGVKDQDLQRMKQVATQMAAIDPSLVKEDVDWLTAFDETVIRREWEKVDHEGVTLDQVKTELSGGWRYMTANVSFVNLQKLFDCGMIKDCHVALTRGPGGQYGFQQNINLNKSMKSLPPGMDLKTMGPMLAMLMQDFDAVLKVEVPGRIIRSNADRTEGRQAIWEMNGKQPDLITRLQELDLRLMFEGKTLDIADAETMN